jgi:peptidoglycan/LPS O-acetylase OafA/YrhL
MGTATTLKATSVRIPSLDGIRAASFLLVFAVHAGGGLVLPGDVGVNVFFFLSGFLITTLMRLEHESRGTVDISHFWLRRALRVLPPFYTVALAATLVALVLYPPGTVYAPSMIAELLFYANYYGIYGVNQEAPGTGVVWSLAVEEHFYLLFPLLYIAMQKWRLSRRNQAYFLWGLCAAVLMWRCVLVFNMHVGLPRIYLATDTRVDSILFGCALAVWNNPTLDNGAAEDSARPPNRWKYLVLPAALGALLWSFTLTGPISLATTRFSVQGVGLTFLFIGAIRFHEWLPFRLLNWRPVVFIGTLSYSLYLVHDVMLRATARLWPQSHAWQRAVVALAASFITSWAIYVAIEKPCARLRKKLTRQQARTFVPEAKTTG